MQVPLEFPLGMTHKKTNTRLSTRNDVSSGYTFWRQASLRVGRAGYRAVARALDHDAINLAQSTAYSGMVALFPALIAAAAVISLLPHSAPLRAEIGVLFDRIMPGDVTPILEGYFVASPGKALSVRAVLVSVLVSLSGASGVIATLMEGIRRAHGLPEDCWTFRQRRARALLLVPLSLLPLGVASGLVVFGHSMALWLGAHVPTAVRSGVFVGALVVRWTVALGGTVGLIAVLYSMGTPKRQSWRSVMPGAVLATALWLGTTVVFGWYVTKFANYSQVYGSLGAGIALLFWLYITCLCVLLGAEFNVQFQSSSRDDAAGS